MKRLLSAIILLAFIVLSVAIEHNKFANNGETLQNTKGKKEASTEENLSGTLNMLKDRSKIQKHRISKEQETPNLKLRRTSRKSLIQWRRRLILTNELETGAHDDSGSVAYFSGKAPFTSDYGKPMHHPPKNN